MAGKAKPVPDGYHSVTPYLCVDGAAEAIRFYQEAFGAKELYRIPGPNGTIGHAELQIGDSRIMLADVNDMDDAVMVSPESAGGVSMGLNIYLPDVDKVFGKAVDAGAKVRRPVKDQFYGDRSGTLEDPFGHIWTIATHVEDLTPEEMNARMASLEQAGH